MLCVASRARRGEKTRVPVVSRRGGWGGRRLIAPFSGSRRFRTGEVGARRLSAGERRSINAFSDGRWFSLSLSPSGSTVSPVNLAE